MIWSWLKRYGWLIGFVIVAAAVYFATYGKVKLSFGEAYKSVKAQGEAEVKAAKLEAELGHAEAIKIIDKENQDAIAKLNAKEKKQAEKLRNNPRGRAALYARVAAKRS